MKAFLIAGGLGIRLRPVCGDIPKCLVPIGGKLLLEYWLFLFEKHGIDEVMVNLHYLADRVIDFLDQREHDLEITPLGWRS